MLDGGLFDVLILWAIGGSTALAGGWAWFRSSLPRWIGGTR